MPTSRKDALRPTIDRRTADYADATTDEAAEALRADLQKQIEDLEADHIDATTKATAILTDLARRLQLAEATIQSLLNNVTETKEPDEKYSLTRAKLIKVLKDIDKGKEPT